MLGTLCLYGDFVKDLIVQVDKVIYIANIPGKLDVIDLLFCQDGYCCIDEGPMA